MLDNLKALLKPSSSSSSHSEKSQNLYHGLKRPTENLEMAPFLPLTSPPTSHSVCLHSSHCSVNIPRTLCPLMSTKASLCLNAFSSNVCMAYPLTSQYKIALTPEYCLSPLPSFAVLHSMHPHLMYIFVYLLVLLSVFD